MPFRSDADFLERLRARLEPFAGLRDETPRSDFDLAPAFRPTGSVTLKPAAVLAPIVQRADGLTMLFTQRTPDMPTHAGQISFPGGRVQDNDSDAVAAALRETEEETGIGPHFITPLGSFDAYQTVTGYRIVPIVGLVEPGFTLRPDPREVADVFETPISFLMDPANHQRHERDWGGQKRAYLAMPFGDRYIWGATAGMIKALYERLYGEMA
jgi:8-oxo-dGTP pyrophosphatase MutT (NUDIX family)